MIDTLPLKIAIASGKGGTGKTMVSTNLAAYLSQNQSVLLVDLDVEEPNDFIFIHGTTESITDQYKMIPEWIEDKCTFCGTCGKSCKYHAIVQLGAFIVVFNELCHSCYACSELCEENALPMHKHKIGEIKKITVGNLTFIESRLNVGEEQSVPLIHQTHVLVDKNCQVNSVQLFDCPPGTSCPVIAAVKNVDFVLLVTEPTPFGLNDLKLAVETVRKLGKAFAIVINRYGIGNCEVEDYCKHEHIQVIARIPFDKNIAKHYSNGELVYDKVEGMDVILQEIIHSITETVKENE